MVEGLLGLLLVAAVLVFVYVIAQWLMDNFGSKSPQMALHILAIILFIIFAIYLVRTFGVILP